MEPTDIVIEEYKALRTEIAQSIAKQHWIAVGGYLLAGTIVAAVLKEVESNLEGLLLIPLIFLSATCLWLVEANRMVRASYFIAYVCWPQLCQLTSHQYRGWEHWIRDDCSPNNKFGQLQDVFQRTSVIVIPGTLSLIAIVYVGLTRSFNLWIVVELIATVIAFCTLLYNSRIVSKLSHFRDAESHKPAESGRREVLTPAPHTTGHTDP